jgi:hypothetical protein
VALKRVWIPSPNYSSRGGTKVRLIVLHTAEGARTYQDLGNFFKNPSSGVSSQVGIDNTPNTVGEYVSRGNKAWTQGNANPMSTSAEMCAFASWSRDTWMNSYREMLNNTARWIAEEAAYFGIPIVKLSASQAQGGSAGVCQHRDLGSWGGNHSDCGNGFPIDDVLAWAKGTAPPTGGTSPPSGGTTAPPFPYPGDHFLGRPSSNPKCHSGFYGGVDTTNVRTWQTRMRQRGWNISADGMYGDQSYSVCRQFQQEKGIGVDGLCWSYTWQQTWQAPVT